MMLNIYEIMINIWRILAGYCVEIPFNFSKLMISSKVYFQKNQAKSLKNFGDERVNCENDM